MLSTFGNRGGFLSGYGPVNAPSGTFTGNVTVGGTLGVTGATTLSSTLEVTGATTLTGAVALNGDSSVEAGNFLRWFNAGGVEAVKGRFSSNVFALACEKGAGTQREVRLQSDGGYYIGVEDLFINCGGRMRPSAPDSTLQFEARHGSDATLNALLFTNNGDAGGNIFTASSGTQLLARMGSDVNQSGTAGYKIVRILAGEVSLGSGAKAILSVDVNTETKFAVMSASASGAHSAGVGGNIGVNTTTAFGSGAGVMGIANATTNPSTNPSGGGVLYSDGGAGKWRGSGGTVTTFGPAEPHCQECGRDCALEWANERDGWHLAVCVWCLTDAIGATHRKGIIRKDQRGR